MFRLVGADVFTGSVEHGWVEALAVSQDRIVVSGPLDAVRARTPNAQEIDMSGVTILPGLIDAHNHFLASGEGMRSLDLKSLDPVPRAVVLRRVTDGVALLQEGGALDAMGFDPAKCSDGPPDRFALDGVSATTQIRLYLASGHGVLVNSAVLAASGLTDESPDPPGGRFIRDDRGRMTGLCLDSAMKQVAPVGVDIGDHGPNFHARRSAANLREDLKVAQNRYLAAGLTTVCDAQVTEREMAIYQAAEVSGDLRIRVVCMPLSHSLDAYLTTGVHTGFGNERLHLGPMKFYIDGTLGGGTALLSDHHGCAADPIGLTFRPIDEIRADVARAARAGWRVGVHAQGDLAIDLLLPALEQAAAQRPRSDLRPRIEHAGLPSLESLRRLGRIGGIAVSQPSYLYEMGDQYLAMLGSRADGLQPWADEVAAGVQVCISSDADVASYRPLDTIASALARRTVGGQVIGQRHRLSLDQALVAHTSQAAWAVGRENDLGQILPGFKADLTIIEGSLRRLGADALRAAVVRATVIDGRVEYGRL